MLGWMPDTGGTQVSRPKLPPSTQWGEAASVSDYNAVWQVLPQEPGPLARIHEGGGPPTQTYEIGEGFLEEVTAKL